MAVPLNGSELISVVPLQANGQPGAIFQQTTVAAVADTRTSSNALTAAGTNQATALVLPSNINRFTTVASGTGVVLPAATKPGQILYIYNAGANVLKVYGNGSDTIDGVAGATGVSLTNALRCMYTCTAATVWISAQLGVVSA